MEEEDYDIGFRDGYEKAIQELDVETGGDGEYVYCSVTDPKHCPTPYHMKRRFLIVSPSPRRAQMSDVREKSLIERLEEASGPDEIMFSTREQFAQIFRDRGIDEFGVDFLRGSEGEHLSLFHMAFRSLDAAVALANRVLPSCLWHFIEPAMGHWVANGSYSDRTTGSAPTLPLAICVALLKALEE